MKILLTVSVLVMAMACDIALQPKVANVAVNKESISVTNDGSDKVPADWKQISVCSFEFYIPPDFKEEKVQGTDSCVKNFVSRNIKLLIDEVDVGIEPQIYSRSGSYSAEKDYLLEKTVVDGKSAEIITFSATKETRAKKDFIYGAVLDIPQVGLTIWAYCKSTEDREITKKILNQ